MHSIKCASGNAHEINKQQLFIIPNAPNQQLMKQAPADHAPIHHKKEFFDLKVSYYPDSVSGDKSEKLDIYLKIKSNGGIQAYRSIFTQQDTPPEIISAFIGLDLVFECFREQSAFEVDLKSGKILLKGVFEFKSRTMEKKTLIHLQKYQITQHEAMLQHILQLEAEVHEMKITKSQRDEKLKMEYERKFEEEKKKIQAAINQSRAQEVKRQRKQKEIQKYIAELESKLFTLTNKINNFEQQNKKKIQQLQRVSEFCEEEIRKGKRKFKKMFQDPGNQGRKMRKPNQTMPTQMRMQENEKSNRKMMHKNRVESRHKSFRVPQFVEEDCRNVQRFSYEGNQITSLRQGEYALLMKKEIPRNSYAFGFRIISTRIGSIIIGVAERSSFINAEFCDIETNTIGYWGNTGYVWGADKFEEHEFGPIKAGDIIQVYVELDKPYIQWRINQQVMSFCEPELFLRESHSVFVPFIEMEHKGDCIEWIEVQ